MNLKAESLKEFEETGTLNLSELEMREIPVEVFSLHGIRELILDDNLLVELPETIGTLSSLTRLSVKRNRLSALPETIGSLPALTALDISFNRLTNLPHAIGNLKTLRRLHAGGNRLGSLPETVGNLTDLTELILWPNRLTELPEQVGNLASLEILHLGDNHLASLPKSIGNLTKLQRLQVWDNQLTSLPESIGDLAVLNFLNLRRNAMLSLPASIGNLTSLTTLFLDGIHLTETPDWLSNLMTLKELHLEDNQLIGLPNWIGKMVNLELLDLSNNELVSVPESIGNIESLADLKLDGNQLTTLPASIGHLKSLRALSLDGNRLTRLPGCLGALTMLASLSVGRNRVSDLPTWLGNLTSIVYLDAANNYLTSLPESIGNLTRLEELSLENNQLTSLPESMGSLTRLFTLSLDRNQLINLPTSIGNLLQLTELTLDGNQLTGLPESIGNLMGLDVLSLHENPLESPLLEIAEDGTAAVKAYLSQLTGQATQLWMSKLLIVGEGAVGKTSLVKAIVGQEHDPNEITTHGIRISGIRLPHPDNSDVSMTLSTWDFGGQDIYHATHQFFLSDRSLFLLLWNARQGWEQAKLPYWLDIIKARAPHAKVVLVATHGEGRPIDLPLTDLKDSYPQIVDSAGVDSRTGEGIDRLRHIMSGVAAELPLMGSRWPRNWLAGVKAIVDSGFQYSTPTKLHSVLTEAGVNDISHQDYLLRTLHLLGDILYFHDDEELRDTIILRPQWVSSYIAKILDSPEVAAKSGVLTRTHERDLWHDLEPGLRDRFLLMMEKFDLSYRITEDSTAASLVVERLPWENPPYQHLWEKSLRNSGAGEIRLRYQLSAMPPGIPTWFIAREHRFSIGIHWRSGALLQYSGDDRVLGIIRADRQRNIVDLAVRGPVPQLFFSVLQDGLESTLKRYEGLEINRLVPCTCAQGDGTEPGRPCLNLYAYGPLLRRMERGVHDVECELSFSRVSVAELLFGIAPSSTEQLLSRLESIDQQLSDFRAESAWTHREFLKGIRRLQARHEAVCPSVFTLTPATGRVRAPGLRRLELRLYCEQPGAFHPVPGAPYLIKQPARWLRAVGPYLSPLVTILKHTAPLAGPILGISAEHLAEQLKNETDLMKELIDQLPILAPADYGIGELRADNLQRYAQLDIDYREIRELLHQLDPAERWAGLSRVYTPEGQILWLCRDHAR